MKPSTVLMPAPRLVTYVPLSTSTELADINDGTKGIIQLIPRQMSKTGWMCRSLKALLLCDDSERSLCRHLKLGEMIPTQGD